VGSARAGVQGVYEVPARAIAGAMLMLCTTTNAALWFVNRRDFFHLATAVYTDEPALALTFWAEVRHTHTHTHTHTCHDTHPYRMLVFVP
jgi:hypothetical protein